jgi:nicotinamidase/pyrazinamidase
MAGVDGKRFPAACLGAEFHSALDISQAELILRRGYHPQIDSYSAFLENDHETSTGLTGYLRERRSSLSVVALEDACRAIDRGGSLAETRNSLAALGIPSIRGALGGP